MRFEETIGISALLNHIDHELSQRIEQALRPIGLTLPQYSTLSAIEVGHTMTNAELARQCFVTPQTMNRILQNLVKLKLVKKKADPKHGLKINFELTATAVKLICDAHILVNQIEVQMISQISPQEFTKLQQTLNLMLSALNKASY